MSDILPYYEQELFFIRRLAQQFAKDHPNTAGRLQLDPDREGSTDPHVERLIEAFALLTARVQHKLNDEFPELTDALLSVLYPHFLAPVPSMAIIQFVTDASRIQAADGFPIERRSRLKSQPVYGVPCRFRTGYPVTLWPIELTTARFTVPPFPSVPPPPPGAEATVRLELECQGEATFSSLNLDKLRFYLHGDSLITANLYELLFNHAIQVVIRPLERDVNAAPIVLEPAKCLTQVGFERSDGLLPYPTQSFLGYRLLTEFFAFPSKFLFVDLGGWKQVARAGMGRKVEVVVFLNRAMERLEQKVDAETFCLGCTPIVNLFEKTSEPISLTQSRFEYEVVPDREHAKGTEVFSVDVVKHIDPATGAIKEYQPFYSFRHGRTEEKRPAYWYASRRPALAEEDRGTDVFLNLVDLDFDPHLPAESTVVVWTTCTNRDLPNDLRNLGSQLSFELEGMAPGGRIRCLRAPTAPLRPPLRRSAHWRLVSHLSLNHLSLCGADEGKQALQEILRLYDFTDRTVESGRADVTRQLVEGITSMQCRPTVGRVGGPTASGYARGIEVSLEFDEDKYLGTGAFLFACVLEHFLGAYVSVNSFSQLKAGTKQGAQFRPWRPRAGEVQLL